MRYDLRRAPHNAFLLSALAQSLIIVTSIAVNKASSRIDTVNKYRTDAVHPKVTFISVTITFATAFISAIIVYYILYMFGYTAVSRRY